jgi:ATP-binding cassette subfamily B protein
VKGTGKMQWSDRISREIEIGKAYDRKLMFRMLRYLRPSTWLLISATALLILFSLTSLTGPYITGLAIDRYISRDNSAGLIFISVVWIGLLVVTGVLQYKQIKVTNLMGQRAMMLLRNEIYVHLQKLPLSFYDKNPSGRLLTRVTNDVEVLNQVFTQGAVAIFGDVFILLGIMVALLVLHLELALTTFISLPALFFVSLRFRSRVREAFRCMRVAVAKINTYLEECLGGISIIKSFRREKRNEEEFDELIDEHFKASLESVKSFAAYFPLVEIIQSFTLALIIWHGGSEITRNELSFGALVAFIQYVGRFFRPIRDLSDKYNILQDAMAAAERIFALLDEPKETDTTMQDAAFDPHGNIRFENVHSWYDRAFPVLRGLSFEIPAGKTTAIVGPTGAGKTTLAGLLLRFYELNRGRITIDGVDIREISRAYLRSAMTLVQQDVFIFSGTIKDNISLRDEAVSKEKVQKAVEASNLGHLLCRLPDGLDSRINTRGTSISTGERQLLAIARALAFDPTIIILDEATASVDSETEALIQKALNVLLKNRTAIVIAHRLSTIRSADQIIVLNRGKIAEHGTHPELLQKGGLYARLYELQFSDSVES